VTSKHISITEEVYRLLSLAKLEDESFSDVIRHLVKRSKLSSSAGLWSDLSEEELSLLRVDP
jgi:predicted CopG family antitoxin